MSAEKLQEQIKQLEEQKKIAEINMHRMDAAILAYKDVLQSLVSPPAEAVEEQKIVSSEECSA